MRPLQQINPNLNLSVVRPHYDPHIFQYIAMLSSADLTTLKEDGRTRDLDLLLTWSLDQARKVTTSILDRFLGVQSPEHYPSLPITLSIQTTKPRFQTKFQILSSKERLRDYVDILISCAHGQEISFFSWHLVVPVSVHPSG